MNFQDLRQMPTRQMPVGSAAVRALSGFGNGAGGLLNSSRPSTPTPTSQQHPQMVSFSLGGGGGGGGGGILSENNSILDRKLGKIVADRQNALRQEQTSTPRLIEDGKRTSATTTATSSVTSEQISSMLNGRLDNWQHQQMQLEDQEVQALSYHLAPYRWYLLIYRTVSESKGRSFKQRESFFTLNKVSSA
jgi:hypothetical protein